MELRLNLSKIDRIEHDLGVYGESVSKLRFLDFGHKGSELVILGNFQSEPLGGRIEEFLKGIAIW